MQCCAVLCCAVLCCAVLCCAVLCCAVLCCAVLSLTMHLCHNAQQKGSLAASWSQYCTTSSMPPISAHCCFELLSGRHHHSNCLHQNYNSTGCVCRSNMFCLPCCIRSRRQTEDARCWPMVLADYPLPVSGRHCFLQLSLTNLPSSSKHGKMPQSSAKLCCQAQVGIDTSTSPV